MPTYVYECKYGHITEREFSIKYQPSVVFCGDPDCRIDGNRVQAKKIIAASGAFLWKAGDSHHLDKDLVKRFNGGKKVTG